MSFDFKKLILIYVGALLLFCLSTFADTVKEPKITKDKKMFAVFDTSQGKFKVELFKKQSPNTVDNFVGLAEGTKEFTDPKTQKKTKKHFFDGLTFHRVIEGFMIQGGDPLGNGMGGPGYKFKNEDSELNFSKPGMLAMANAGRDTNGSQFFITTASTPFLNGNYTIFGQVAEGFDVVEKISKVKKKMSPGGEMSEPIEKITINKITIQK